MKLLLVLTSDETFGKISASLNPASAALIRYRHIIKAMDNIDEVDPAGIIISARDFPRHWKTLVQFVRAERPRSACPVVLLRGEVFSGDELAKAEYLEIDAVLGESLEDEAGLRRIGTLFGADKHSAPAGGEPEEAAAFGFMFTNPETQKIVTGTVTSVNSSGLSVEVDRPALIKGLKAGAEITGCSLRAGEAILSPSCVIRKTTYGGVLSLDFTVFPEADRAALAACL